MRLTNSCEPEHEQSNCQAQNNEESITPRHHACHNATKNWASSWCKADHKVPEANEKRNLRSRSLFHHHVEHHRHDDSRRCSLDDTSKQKSSKTRRPEGDESADDEERAGNDKDLLEVEAAVEPHGERHDCCQRKKGCSSHPLHCCRVNVKFAHEVGEDHVHHGLGKDADKGEAADSDEREHEAHQVLLTVASRLG